MENLRVDVDKFGGKTANVAEPVDYESAGSMTIVRDIVRENIRAGKKVVMVVSAFSETTDHLVGLEERIRDGEIKDEAQIRGYLDEFVKKPHKKLAYDLDIPIKSTMNKGFDPVYEEVVEASKVLINSKKRLPSDNLMLCVHSLLPLTGAFLDSLGKKNNGLADIIQNYSSIQEYLEARDKVVTAGERMILPFYRNFMNYRRSRLLGSKTWAVTIPAEKIFYTDNKYGSANINMDLSLEKVKDALLPALKDKSVKVVIIPGFYGATKGGSITSFGRGGSDLTAVALAYFLSLIEEVEVGGPCLTKDTNGILVVNPKEIYSTRDGEGNIPFIGVPLVPYDSIPRINNLNYDDAREIEAVHAGAVQFAEKHKMTICVRKISDYFGSKASTISKDETTKGYKLIGGIKDSVLFDTKGIRNEPGEMFRLIGGLYKYGINVSKIVHSFGYTLLGLDRGSERLSQARKEMEGYEPISLKDCSLIGVSGDVLDSDRIDFENMSKILGAYVLSPWVEGHKTLSTIIPRFPDKEGVDFYRAALTAYYGMWYSNQTEGVNKIIHTLGGVFLSENRDKRK